MATARAVARRIWDVAWEPGDRFEVRACAIADGSVQLVLPPVLLDPATVPEVVVDEVGTDIPFNFTTSGTSLTLSGAASRWAADTNIEVIWLEYVSPHRYRLVLERSRPFTADAPTAAPDNAIEFASADHELLRRPMPRLTPVEFHLGLRATQLATHPGFDRLICLPMVGRWTCWNTKRAQRKPSCAGSGAGLCCATK